jgi:hypothetical protein
MRAWCARCGTEIDPVTTFCTGCPASAEALQSASKNGKWPSILALICFFALGFWLGHRIAPKCPACPAPPTASSGGAGSGGGGGGMGRVLGAGGKVEGGGGGGSAGIGAGSGDMARGGHSSANHNSANGATIGEGHDGTAVGVGVHLILLQ